MYGPDMIHTKKVVPRLSVIQHAGSRTNNHGTRVCALTMLNVMIAVIAMCSQILDSCVKVGLTKPETVVDSEHHGS